LSTPKNRFHHIALINATRSQIGVDVEDIVLSDSKMNLDDHSYALQYSDLVAWALTQGLALDLDAIQTEISEDIACADSFASNTNNQVGFSIEVAGIDYSIAEDATVNFCSSVEDAFINAVIGIFESDTGMEY
jgi:hypothetical protein